MMRYTDRDADVPSKCLAESAEKRKALVSIKIMSRWQRQAAPASYERRGGAILNAYQNQYFRFAATNTAAKQHSAIPPIAAMRHMGS